MRTSSTHMCHRRSCQLGRCSFNGRKFLYGCRNARATISTEDKLNDNAQNAKIIVVTPFGCNTHPNKKRNSILIDYSCDFKSIFAVITVPPPGNEPIRCLREETDWNFPKCARAWQLWPQYKLNCKKPSRIIAPAQAAAIMIMNETVKLQKRTNRKP